MLENQIQLVYFYPFAYPSEEEVVVSKNPSRLKGVSYALAAFGAFLMILFLAPVIWTHIHPVKALEINTDLANSQVKDLSYQPEIDNTLPLGNFIQIRSIGINAPINEGPNESYENELKLGIWRVNDFGTAYYRGKSMILVAHRFGYLDWSKAFRHTNSFYNLPSVKNGDVVEIDWNQRKYMYAVYGSGEGSEIADYAADLILYTCRDLSSNVRIFKYARLIQI